MCMQWFFSRLHQSAGLPRGGANAQGPGDQQGAWVGQVRIKVWVRVTNCTHVERQMVACQRHWLLMPTSKKDHRFLLLDLLLQCREKSEKPKKGHHQFLNFLGAPRLFCPGAWNFSRLPCWCSLPSNLASSCAVVFDLLNGWRLRPMHLAKADLSVDVQKF